MGVVQQLGLIWPEEINYYGQLWLAEMSANTIQDREKNSIYCISLYYIHSVQTVWNVQIYFFMVSVFILWVYSICCPDEFRRYMTYQTLTSPLIVLVITSNVIIGQFRTSSQRGELQYNSHDCNSNVTWQYLLLLQTRLLLKAFQHWFGIVLPCCSILSKWVCNCYNCHIQLGWMLMNSPHQLFFS